MKHFTQTTANGLHTPPCGSSHGNLSSFYLRKSLLMLFLLLIVGTNAAWADNITFQGTEIFYFDKSSNSGWGTVVANDADVYLEFANSGNNATKSSAAQWEVENSILKVTVPSGTYNQVRIVRGQKGNPSSIWNTFSWINLQSGKNQILYGGSWDTYGGGGGDPEPFDGCAFTANSTMYFDLRDAAWYSDGACLFAEFFTENTSRGESSQLSEAGTSHVYSFQIPNRNDITKVVINRYNNSGKQYKWGYTADMTAETAGTNDCIYMPEWTGNPVSCNWTTFGSGSITTNCGPAALNCRLMGDFWLKADNGWLGTDKGPQFIDNGDGTATISYLVNTQAPRFTFVKDGSETTENKWDDTHSTSGFKNDFGSKKYKFNKIASGVKKVTLTYTEATDKLVGVYGAYDVDYTGWKLYVDGGSALDMDNSGQRVVSLASGDHTFYITDGSATTFYGVNKFGGMYLSTSYTNQGVTITFPSQRYYDTGSTYKFNINGENIPMYPINGQYDLSAKFSINKAANVTFSFDGGVISLAAVEPVAPHTVTIHPNNGAANFTMDVADGGTISSIAATYGNGTASWYKDAELTQAFTLNSSTVTEDMDLYAKWSVSGNYYFVSCMQTANDGGGESGNWNNGYGQKLTHTFIAPSGHMPFEVIKDKDWNQKINGGNYADMFDNSRSNVTISAAHGHMDFTLSEPKQVTVAYNGKVSVNIANYSFDNSRTWRIKTSWGNGGAAWNYNTYMTNNGTTNATAILRNVPAGQNSFVVTTQGEDNDAMATVGTETFNALYVDTSNPSSGLTWNNTSARRDGSDNFNSTTPQTDNRWRNCSFSLSEVSDIRITFDGGKIRCDILPKYTVTFNSNGGSEVASQTMFEGLTASEPADPDRGGYEFDSWRISSVEGAEYNFESPVTANITLVAKWNQVIKHTVTFDSNGGSEVDAQDVVENETATEPAEPTRDNYTFNGWKLNDEAYEFSTPVTGNITLVADWSYTPAHISSVSINESSIYTWAGDAITYTLVPTLVPADIASVTVSWSSSDNNVATVENGVITPQGAGTATITCIATDYYSGSQTATCAVKVAPCAKELAGAPSYNVTITGYNSYEDGDATLTGLWNESSDNTEPATLTVCNVRIGNNGGSNEYYAYDNNGTVSIEQRSSDDVDKWYRIEAATNLYYLKNVSTGKYMYVGSTNTESSKGNGWSGNGDWLLRSVYTSAANGETDSYKFYSAKDDWNNDIIISRADASNGSTATATDFVLSRQQLTGTPSVWSDVVANTVSASRGAKQGGNAYKGFQSAFENIENVANPAYIQSQMNSSYYRMKANATVQANLGSALAEADVISVELYADAATSVTLCKTNGDVVATINLNADAATEYTYLVTAGTPLDGENAFIIKAADNHAGIRSITVTPMVASNPAQPDLHWTTTPVTAHLLLDGNFTYTAASNDSQGAISYASEDTDVAQVDASTGEVTPSGAGTTNIIATITADECYTTYSISYEVSFLGLQDYIATDGVNSVTLPGDYVSENIVINKAITINGGGHSIGNLKVENEGDLTLSSALTVADFTICAKAGNTTTPAASGQVRNATNLTVNGEAYFLYTVDPSGHVQYGWYDFTVPFPVNVMTGIKGIQDEVLKENFVNETDYAIMEHLGDKQAAGQYAYKKFRGVMQPNKLYSITLDDDYNYNTIRFQKTNDGALVASDEVTLNAYAGEAKHANWNGVGNGTLHHADAGLSVDYVQVYQSGTKTFLPVDRAQYSLVIGSAFMVQQTGTMTLNQATHDKLLAPKREASEPTAIQIASEGKPFSDQLFISADEMAGQGYNQGVDVAKAGNIGNVNVPQIWTNAYNSKLCAHEAQLINGEAQYALSLYAPANGSYTLTSTSIPAGTTLYLTQNDHIIWDMSENYTFDLNKGTTTEYGLLLVQSHKIPTGIENGEWTNDEGRKVLHNGILYILHNGKVFNAQGAMMK